MLGRVQGGTIKIEAKPTRESYVELLDPDRIACSCSSSVFIKIKMSSKHTIMIPLAMTVRKTLFIMVWKIAVLCRCYATREFSVEI